MAARATHWDQVGARFESLGTHLRGHFDEVNAEASTERAAFEKSVHGLIGALEDGFAAAGKAVRDPVLRQDLSEVATSVHEALLATFEGAGAQVRGRLARPAPAEPVTKRAAPSGRPAAAKTAARTASQAKAPRAKSAARTPAAH